MFMQKLLKKGLCVVAAGAVFASFASVNSAYAGPQCGTNLFNPALLTEADFTNSNGTYSGTWNGYLNNYISTYPFGFVAGKQYRVVYTIDCSSTNVGTGYLGLKLRNGSVAKPDRNVCEGATGLQTVSFTGGGAGDESVIGMQVGSLTNSALPKEDLKIAGIMVVASDVDTSSFIAYDPCITIATENSLQKRFMGVGNRLSTVTDLITGLITDSASNTSDIGTLLDEKQNRPLTDCPTGKKCLLVKDKNNKDNWYPIVDCDSGNFIGVGDPLSGTYTDGVCTNANETIGCNAGEWYSSWSNGLVIGGSRNLSIAEQTVGQIVRLPANIDTTPGDVCLCQVQGYKKRTVEDGAEVYGSRVNVTTDYWIIAAVDPSYADETNGSSSCATRCSRYAYGDGGNETTRAQIRAYYNALNNSCLESSVFAEATWVDPNMFVPKFIVTTTNMGASDVFAFEMSAQGTFTVDWDDGTVETIDRSATTSSNTYRHQYQTAGTRDIKFGGVATGYNENGASSFKVHSDSVTKVASLSGSLGGLMPTLGQTSALQPTFVNTFLGCTNLTSVPVGLFNGVNGNRDHMFSGTFAGTGLTGSGVPSGLFSNITGHASNLFASTFAGCTNLTSVPQGLFSSVSGADTQMFMYTFGNTGLTGQNALPSDLFSHVTGNAEALFQSTFEDCTSLTTIPGSLFSGITGSAAYMFENTFSGCSSLASIPGNLFSGVTGGANSLFLFTFANCSALTSLPAGLFSGINQAAQWMFNQTFVNCTHLTGYIPASMFSGLIAAGSPNIDGTEVYPSIPGMMNSMFANNGGLVGNGNCPTGTTQVTTGYEQYWGGAVACQPNS